MKEKNNRQRIILLSDLWGKEKSDWIAYYTAVLEKYFDVKYYDCCDLGNIDKSDYSEENLHHQFVDGGIARAVESLLQKEKEFIHVLGFSIGGYIAWKACLSGLKTQSLFAISSGSSASTYNAASPQTSGRLVLSETTTGVPLAIASNGGNPNPSAKDGKQNTVESA